MPLDLKALEAANKKLQEERSLGGDLFSASDIKPNTEVDIRILPPPDSLAGLYFLKTVDYKLSQNEWVKSLATFGEECPVEALIAEAKTSDDAGVVKLAKQVEQSVKFMVPIIRFTSDAKGNIMDGEAVILQCGWSVIKEFNKYLQSPKYQNDCEDGLLDRAQGLNFSIERTGSGFGDTRYGVKPWPKPTDMSDPKWDAIYANVPDPVHVYKNLMGDISDHEEKTRQFLFGGSGRKKATDD